VERAGRHELPVVAFHGRQEPVYARLLYLQLDRAAAFSVVLDCEETQRYHSAALNVLRSF